MRRRRGRIRNIGGVLRVAVVLLVGTWRSDCGCCRPAAAVASSLSSSSSSSLRRRDNDESWERPPSLPQVSMVPNQGGEENHPLETTNNSPLSNKDVSSPELIDLVPVVVLDNTNATQGAGVVLEEHELDEITKPPRHHKTDPPANVDSDDLATKPPRHKTDPPTPDETTDPPDSSMSSSLEPTFSSSLSPSPAPTRPKRHKTDAPKETLAPKDSNSNNNNNNEINVDDELPMVIPADDITIPRERDDDDDEEEEEHDDVTDDLADFDEQAALEGRLRDEQKEARLFGGFGFFLAIVAMVFTAHQMSENPDGIYASVCRLIITITGCVIKIILMPCRSLLGGRYRSHMPVSTIDSYREPYRGSPHVMELS